MGMLVPLLNRKCDLSVKNGVPYVGKKVMESRNRPGVAKRVPGGLGSQIS
jgi:hypothetical protein